MKQEFILRNDTWGYRLQFSKRSVNALYVANAASMEMIREGEDPRYIGPLLEDLSIEGLQSLMDELWNAGIRPADVGTAGHLAATQSHLRDMRKLVAAAYKVEL